MYNGCHNSLRFEEVVCVLSCEQRANLAIFIAKSSYFWIPGDNLHCRTLTTGTPDFYGFSTSQWECGKVRQSKQVDARPQIRLPI